jgi:hypothetical protein
MRLLLILVTLALLAVPGASRAQDAAAVLAENRALVEKASRTSIGPVIAALVESGGRWPARTPEPRRRPTSPSCGRMPACAV